MNMKPYLENLKDAEAELVLSLECVRKELIGENTDEATCAWALSAVIALFIELKKEGDAALAEPGISMRHFVRNKSSDDDTEKPSQVNESNKESEQTSFQKYLKQARGSRSFRRIEKDSGIHFSYLWELESGRKEAPTPDILRRLATALGVPYMRLMFEAGYIDEYEEEN